MNIVLSFSLSCLTLLLVSCATIFQPGPDPVAVDSDPPGAQVLLDGVSVGATPVQLHVRRRSRGAITVQRDGYYPVTFGLATYVNGTTFINLISPWGVGFIVDAVAGNCSAWESPGMVKLSPVARDPSGTAPAENNKSATDSAVVLSSGSAFLIDREYAITAFHVVEGAHVIRVHLQGLKPISASVVAGDESNDICLLKLASPIDNEPLAFAESGSLKNGERVFLLGYPLHDTLGNTVPVIGEGIVAGLQGLRGDASRFQLTAPANNGSSGAPVLDASGNVVGILQSKLSDIYALTQQRSVPQGFNFAFKADVARVLLSDKGVELKTKADRPAIMSAQEIFEAAARSVLQVSASRTETR